MMSLDGLGLGGAGVDQLGQLVVFSNSVHAHLGGNFDFSAAALIGRIAVATIRQFVALAEHDTR